MILSLIELMPIPGKRQEIVELLRFSAERLRTRPGCLRSGVYETSDEDDDKTILYLEQWRSEEDLHRHIKSNLYLGVLNAIDLAIGPPLISFNEVSNTKSMDLIVALRTSGAA